MSTKLQIRVTKAILAKSAYCGHVKKGGMYMASDDDSVCPATNCAIALAIRDILPSAQIGQTAIYPFGVNPHDSSKGPFSVILLPGEATDFIREFDDKLPEERKKMDPFEFSIDIPDNVLQHAFPIEKDLKQIFSEHATLRFI